MEKPVLNKALTAEKINELEGNGHVFKVFDNQKIIGRSKNAGYEILFLEDGSEIIRAPDGKFIEEWPEEA